MVSQAGGGVSVLFSVSTSGSRMCTVIGSFESCKSLLCVAVDSMMSAQSDIKLTFEGIDGFFNLQFEINSTMVFLATGIRQYTMIKIEKKTEILKKRIMRQILILQAFHKNNIHPVTQLYTNYFHKVNSLFNSISATVKVN